MSSQSHLADFIDDELLRAPMTMDAVADAVAAQWRLSRAGIGFGRGDTDPTRVLKNHREDLMAAALRALRKAVLADLAATAAAPAEAGMAITDSTDPALSLIDEDDVVADIEVARCIEAVKLHAELELRDLQTYTSALADDPNVSRDTNPFRPELFVRALWQGVLALPLPRSMQAAFMRQAAQPLAQALKQAYGAAADRLDSQGVTPARHRTIVMVGGTFVATGPRKTRQPPPADLNALRQQWPTVEAVTPLPAAGSDGPQPQADPQVVTLLTRLFDEIHADRGLPAELCTLLLQLQPAALRLASANASLLSTYDHPLWRFMDLLAHQLALSPAHERARTMTLARSLVDHVGGPDTQDSSPFIWAIERLAAMNRHALAQALQAAAPQIAQQRRQARAVPGGVHDEAPLDIATLDTVPAELMDDGAIPPDASGARSPTLGPGEHLRVYLQGAWRMLQLLERDDALQLWVLRESADGRLWALRPAAMDRLALEGLALPVRVRSLVRRAADQVLHAP